MQQEGEAAWMRTLRGSIERQGEVFSEVSFMHLQEGQQPLFLEQVSM